MFDLAQSQSQAEQRFGQLSQQKTRGRRPRSDRGLSRGAPEAQSLLAQLLAGYDKPVIKEVLTELAQRCLQLGVRCPSRATVYKLIDSLAGRVYTMAALPPAVRRALYNLDGEAVIPGRQVAFYCFNYGDLEAACFAAGMPWLELHQAGRMRGWRAKSRGLWEAVCRARGI